MLMSETHKDDLLAAGVVQNGQCSEGAKREVQPLTPVAYRGKLLSEQHLDIWLIIDNQHPHGHGTGPSEISLHARAFSVVGHVPLSLTGTGCQWVQMLRRAEAALQTSGARAVDPMMVRRNEATVRHLVPEECGLSGRSLWPVISTSTA